tara:strand:- start:160 stop:342 length:183 start_codon:yes stop_codon:yes gene_type:complete
MNTAKLAFVSGLMEDKNGTPMMYGRTNEFIKDKVFYSGELVTCYNEDLFKQFVIGLEIAL